MSDRLWWRIGAACGILYVVLEITGLGFGIANSFAAVDLDSSKREIARAFANPAPTGAWIGIYLEVLSVLFFIVFTARLWATLRRAEGDPGWLSLAAFGSAMILAAMTLFAFSSAGAAAYWAGHGLQRSRSPSGRLVSPLASSPGPSARYSLRFVPQRFYERARWLGWSAGVIAVASLAAVAAQISGPAQLPAFLFLLWILVASIVLMRREDEPVPVLTGALSPSS